MLLPRHISSDLRENGRARVHLTGGDLQAPFCSLTIWDSLGPFLWSGGVVGLRTLCVLGSRAETAGPCDFSHACPLSLG